MTIQSKKIPALFFFIVKASEYSLPIFSLYLALFFLGQVFYLNEQAYGFFCLLITFFIFDPLLNEEKWLESLYYNCKICSYLFFYLFLKCLVISFTSSIIAYYLTSWSFLHCQLLCVVMFLSLFLSHLLTFFFNQLLPSYLLPFLCMAVNAGLAFFFSAGLSKVDPSQEIQILLGIILVLLPNLRALSSLLLDLKYGPFDSDET